MRDLLPPYLQDYFSYYGRMDRWWFNLILFGASIPWFIIMIYGMGESFNALQQHQQNPGAIAEMLLRSMNAPHETDWFKLIIGTAIELAMLPAFIKRLRDAGMDVRWTGIIYVPFLDKFLSNLLGDGLPALIGMPFGVAAFIIITILTFKKSAPRRAAAKADIDDDDPLMTDPVAEMKKQKKKKREYVDPATFVPKDDDPPSS